LWADLFTLAHDDIIIIAPVWWWYHHALLLHACIWDLSIQSVVFPKLRICNKNSGSMTTMEHYGTLAWSHSSGVRTLISSLIHSLVFLNQCPTVENKSDISYLKTSQTFNVLIHSGKPSSVG